MGKKAGDVLKLMNEVADAEDELVEVIFDITIREEGAEEYEEDELIDNEQKAFRKAGKMLQKFGHINNYGHGNYDELACVLFVSINKLKSLKNFIDYQHEGGDDTIDLDYDFSMSNFIITDPPESDKPQIPFDDWDDYLDALKRKRKMVDVIEIERIEDYISHKLDPFLKKTFGKNYKRYEVHDSEKYTDFYFDEDKLEILSVNILAKIFNKVTVRPFKYVKSGTDKTVGDSTVAASAIVYLRYSRNKAYLSVSVHTGYSGVAPLYIRVYWGDFKKREVADKLFSDLVKTDLLIKFFKELHKYFKKKKSALWK